MFQSLVLEATQLQHFRGLGYELLFVFPSSLFFFFFFKKKRKKDHFVKGGMVVIVRTLADQRKVE